VAAFHVLEHLTDPVRFLAFARRALKEEGILYLAVPNLYTLHPDLIELFFLCRNWHVQTFTPESLAGLVGRGGFEVVKIEEEEPSAMLRSSVAVLARRTGRPAGETDTANPERVEQALRRFHDRLDAGLASVRKNVERRREKGRGVAVYGGGIHTRLSWSFRGYRRR
jgi:SAM-dependent methyltransferase